MTSLLEELIQGSRSLSEGSRKSYCAIVRMFVRDVGDDPKHWTPRRTEQWISEVAERVSPQTANTYLAALKRASKRYAQMAEGTDFAAAIEAFHEGAQVRPHRALSHAEVARLLATCATDTSPIGLRDHLILRLGLDGGLRRAEIAALRWCDYDHEARQLAITGKGKPGIGRPKLATLPLGGEVVTALEALRAAQRRPPTATDPILLRGIQPVSGKPTGLSPTGVWQIVKTRARQAGIRATTHELRHTLGTHALEAGAPVWRVQKQLRHEDTGTTLGYAHDPALAGDDRPIGDIVTTFRKRVADKGTGNG